MDRRQLHQRRRGARGATRCHRDCGYRYLLTSRSLSLAAIYQQSGSRYHYQA